MLPVSNDTLLRVVRRRGAPSFTPPSVVGIDDWAWRRNLLFGVQFLTFVCTASMQLTVVSRIFAPLPSFGLVWDQEF
jgi:hypothetical protein